LASSFSRGRSSSGQSVIAMFGLLPCELLQNALPGARFTRFRMYG